MARGSRHGIENALISGEHRIAPTVVGWWIPDTASLVVADGLCGPTERRVAGAYQDVIELPAQSTPRQGRFRTLLLRGVHRDFDSFGVIELPSYATCHQSARGTSSTGHEGARDGGVDPAEQPRVAGAIGPAGLPSEQRPSSTGSVSAKIGQRPSAPHEAPSPAPSSSPSCSPASPKPPTESANTKIRLALRCDFGFHSAEVIIVLAKLTLGGLRQE
jgi:hypothetical protein